MEEMMYIMLVIASAMFVVKTIVSWIQYAKHEYDRKIDRKAWETEKQVRDDTRTKMRLEQLEKFQEKVVKSTDQKEEIKQIKNLLDEYYNN